MEVRILAFFAGLCLLHGQATLPPTWLLPVLVPAAVIALRRPRWWWLSAGVAGVLWGWWHAAAMLQQRLPVELDGAVLTVYGTVSGLPEVRAERVRFRFEISHSVEVPGLTGTAWLSWYDAEAPVQPGEVWRLRVRLRRPRGFANPAGFDYAGWLFRQRVDATGYVRAGGSRRLARPVGREWLARLRGVLAIHIADRLRDHPMLPVVLAVTVGDRSQMTAAHWRVFAATGTGHLMAISGLHIGMVATTVFLAVRSLWGLMPAVSRSISGTDAAAVLALAAALAYAALAGFSLPTRRALVMVTMALFALLRRRRTGVRRGLCVALMLVLLIDPLAPLSPGLWLSFGAVATIAWTMQGYYPRASGAWAWLRVQLAVFAGLLPATLWHFGQASVLSPMINLVMVPLFGVAVMPLVLSGAALSPVLPGLSGVFLKSGGWLLSQVWPVLERLAQSDVAMWQPAPRPLWTLIAALAASAVALSPLARRLAPLCVLLLLPVVAWRPPPLAQGVFRVDVLDVGQGLTAVVTTRHHRLVFDTGGQFRSGTRLADLVLLPYLRAGPDPQLLIVSHADLDHRAGVETVLEAYPAIGLLAGEPLQGRTPKPCRAGQQWRWDDVRFELVHPDRSTDWSGNNASCVLRVAGAGGTVLLTGDIEAVAEARLVASDRALGADVVVGLHHGSETSSTAGLIAATSAQHVVFPAGHGNRWGFPKPAVTRRWQDAGARVWITGRDGAVTVFADPSTTAVEVSGWRHSSSHYWTR
ncbi:MAG: DNA internalization-related competence protein ComEC/Rec2 [Pseudomonadota bacterium]